MTTKTLLLIADLLDVLITSRWKTANRRRISRAKRINTNFEWDWR